MAIDDNDNMSNEDIINSALNELTGDNSGTQQTDTSTDNTTTGTPANTQDGNNVSDVGGVTDPNNPPQGQQNTKGQDKTQASSTGRVRDDGKGNLVDAQGRLVAPAGAERRWYNEAQGALRQSQQTQRELAETKSRLEPLETAFATFQTLQMPPQDIAIGAQLYKAFQQNPKAAIEYMMTEARKNGVQIEGLGSSVDMGALASIIDQRLKPLIEDRAAAKRDQELTAQADREYNAFVNNVDDYPHARTHEQAIVTLMQQRPDISMDKAYLVLENAALREGLDFSKPLQPQWEAKRNGSTTSNVVTPANTGITPRAPLPGGRPSGSATQMGNTRIANPSTSSTDIVREAMREFGL